MFLETFVWKQATTSGTLPSPRDSHTCSSWKNKVIVIGGEDAHDYYLSDVHILDTGTYHSSQVTLLSIIWATIDVRAFFAQPLIYKPPHIMLVFYYRYSRVDRVEHFRSIITTSCWSYNHSFWKELVCFRGIYWCPKLVQWPSYARYWYVLIPY